MKSMTIRVAILVLSMPLAAVAVKAQNKDAISGNKENSAKDDQSAISKLVQTLMASGRDGKYVNGVAQAAGLDRPMPMKGIMVPIGKEARKCHIVYEPDEATGNKPFCVYFIRTKITQHDFEERYYRLSMNGQLEKVITLKNKLDDQGKALREGRSRTEEDMKSPEIKKAFKTEMTFWLKDWLKQQQKLAAEKASAKTDPETAAPAAP